MSTKKAIFFIILIIVGVIVITMSTNRESNKEISYESTKKFEMVAHYGKSAEVELLKISDNNWRLENYNDSFVTIRHVKVSTSFDGAGETTQSVRKIQPKNSINLRNLSVEDGFYIYDSYGMLTGWIRVSNSYYVTTE